METAKALEEIALAAKENRRAYLYGAYLYGAYLYGANLSGANLSGANLSRANLSRANLSRANLYGADLYGADLFRANLYGADLFRAKNLPDMSWTLIVPQDGTVTGWKKCRNDVIVKLLIPATAKRHNATGRKCRAERAKVLQVIGADEGVSCQDESVRYVKGKVVIAKNYDPDRWNECSGGIHFFITRKEAEDYDL